MAINYCGKKFYNIGPRSHPANLSFIIVVAENSDTMNKAVFLVNQLTDLEHYGLAVML
jgi:hypothetical protein